MLSFDADSDEVLKMNISLCICSEIMEGTLLIMSGQGLFVDEALAKVH